VTTKEQATNFVHKFPLLFNSDKDFWIEQVEYELIQAKAVRGIAQSAEAIREVKEQAEARSVAPNHIGIPDERRREVWQAQGIRDALQWIFDEADNPLGE
jgi:hypothetical protein